MATKTKKLPSSPPNPCVKNFSRAHHKRAETFIKTKVRPYLQYLLDTAQSKLRTEIYFSQGMGSYNLTVDDRGHYHVHVAVHEDMDYFVDEEDPQYDERVADRFPELRQFMRIVLDVLNDDGEGLDSDVGDIKPTVPPRQPTARAFLDVLEVGQHGYHRGTRVQRMEDGSDGKLFIILGHLPRSYDEALRVVEENARHLYPEVTGNAFTEAN